MSFNLCGILLLKELDVVVGGEKPINCGGRFMFNNAWNTRVVQLVSNCVAVIVVGCFLLLLKRCCKLVATAAAL